MNDSNTEVVSPVDGWVENEVVLRKHFQQSTWQVLKSEHKLKFKISFLQQGTQKSLIRYGSCCSYYLVENH